MYGLYQIVKFTIFDIVKGLASPFFIVISFIIYFQYRGRIKNPLIGTIVSILYGVIGGIICTVALIYLRIYIIPIQYIYILFISLILSMINSRFICFSYGGSIISLISIIFNYPKIDIYELMTIISLLHAIEAFLILINGNSQRVFNIFKLKGQIKAGYEFNRFWPIPFVVFIGDTMIRPFLLFAIVSYGDFTVGKYPRIKTLETSLALFLYSSLLFIITNISPYKFIPPIFSLLGHELIIFINRYRENINLNEKDNLIKGVNVIDVSYRGIARKLGIRKGDVILKINHLHLTDAKDFKDLPHKRFSKINIEFFNYKQGIIRRKYIGKKVHLGIKTQNDLHSSFKI